VVNFQFQPVLPLALTDNWNLITRPVFQAMNSTPYVNQSGNLRRVTGFGDTILATLLSPSPKLAGRWLLAAGPSFIFPTASNSRLGQNKWQLGPAGIFGYHGDKWLGAYALKCIGFYAEAHDDVVGALVGGKLNR
jgi:hypothetical protein